MPHLPPDLTHHGDQDVVAGLVDLAVNVRAAAPAWLMAVLRDSIADLTAYPDQTTAREAVARRHGRPPDEVLLTAGAAEAFVLLARALHPRHAVVVHPQFTEPEAALRAAGHRVDRVVLAPSFTLDPALVPESADLVVIGNPTNPTSVLHPAATVRALLRPGRIVVVDEAFADAVPGEPESLAADRAEGLVVVRSLTKTWGLAGLRVGYVLASADLVRRLAQGQPLWPVSTPALAACVAVSQPEAVAEARGLAEAGIGHRRHLLARLADVSGIDVVPGAAPFLLLRHSGGQDLRPVLLEAGFAVRRGGTFPGLDPSWIRVAVKDPATSDRFASALRAVVATHLVRSG